MSLRESTATLAAKKVSTVVGRMTKSKRVGECAVWNEKALKGEYSTRIWRIQPEGVWACESVASDHGPYIQPFTKGGFIEEYTKGLSWKVEREQTHAVRPVRNLVRNCNA